MGDEDDEEESDAIVTQVLDELGLQLTDQMTAVPAAPDNSISVAGAAGKNKAGPVATEGGGGGADDDLQARLENLRKDDDD